MRREYALISTILMFAIALLHSVCKAENTNMLPTITISHFEGGSLIVQLTNTTSEMVMVDMSRNQQGVIRCIQLLMKGTNGVVLTSNAVFADGYWTPCALESQIVPNEQFRENLVGVLPSSSVLFRVRLEPFLLNVVRKEIKTESVSPKLMYFTTGGDSREVKGQFFNIDPTRGVPHKR